MTFPLDDRIVEPSNFVVSWRQRVVDSHCDLGVVLKLFDPCQTSTISARVKHHRALNIRNNRRIVSACNNRYQKLRNSAAAFF